MEKTNASPGPRLEAPVDAFNPPSIKFAKRAAGRLRKVYLDITGVVLKLSKSQEVLAHVFGHKDWFALARLIERDGYLPSPLDAALSEADFVLRRMQLMQALELVLELHRHAAAKIVFDARLTAGAIASPVKVDAVAAARQRNRLPRASLRPGLSEIYLTAFPFSLAGLRLPLPGWVHYAVVAAPVDNSALWVRFCLREEVEAEALHLVRSVESLTDGSLSVAHVPSQVQEVAPNLVDSLAAIGVEVKGGRPAILAAHLQGRLASTLHLVSTKIRDSEDVPSTDELSFFFNVAEGVVEIPDSKGRPESQDSLMERISFAIALEQLIGDRRRLQETAPRHQEPKIAGPQREAFKEDEDGRLRFRSGVHQIGKGSPIYRLRIDLHLFDEDGETERRATVTRVIDVPVHYDLWALHVAIQDAMGWADYHLHEFAFYTTRTGRKAVRFASPNDDDPAAPTSAGERLWNHIPSLANRPGRYLYDFGDHWDHDVTLVGTVSSDGGGYPRCISGERACPPEDCGSGPGYFRVLDVMGSKLAVADADHEISRKEMRDWLKGHVNVSWPYRPDDFDPASVEFDDPEARWDYAYGDPRSVG